MDYCIDILFNKLWNHVIVRSDLMRTVSLDSVWWFTWGGVHRRQLLELLLDSQFSSVLSVSSSRKITCRHTVNWLYTLGNRNMYLIKKVTACYPLILSFIWHTNRIQELSEFGSSAWYTATFTAQLWLCEP